MFLNFPLKASNSQAFEARAKAQGWLVETEDAGNTILVPAPGVQIAYLGKKVVVPATYDADGNVLTEAVLSDYDRVDVRLHSEKAEAEIDGLGQTDAEGNLLPLRQRTKFGRKMERDGVKENIPDPARKVTGPQGDFWSLYEDQNEVDHEWQ